MAAMLRSREQLIITRFISGIALLLDHFDGRIN